MKTPAQTEIDNQKLVKILKKTVKRVIAQQGINPATRKGNKELELLVKKIAKEPLNNHEQAQKIGEKIAETIVEISQKQGKTNLDRGVIRQLAIQGKIPLITEILTSILSPTSSSSQVISDQKAEVKETTEVAKPVETISLPKAKETVETPQISAPVVEITEPVDTLSLSTASETPETTEATETVDTPSLSIASETPETTEVTEAVDSFPVSTTQETPETTEVTEAVDSSPVSTTQETADTLKDRISEDIKAAMKSQDKIRLETVRSIKKALIEKEVSLRPSGKDSLTPEQEIELLAQQAKQRRESIEQFQKAGRDDLAGKEAQELAIIETYLPKQLSDEELSSILDDIMATVGATSAKDIGKVMSAVMQQLKGKADGKKIQALVKSKLE